MNITRNEMLFRQIQAALGPGTDLNRLIPVGPLELHTMFGEKLGLRREAVPCPELPYSTSQLRGIIAQLEQEDANAILTLDLPDVGGKPTDLYQLALWFGHKDQGTGFGSACSGLLNLNTLVSTPLFSPLAKQMGTVSRSPQWRIRYLNLSGWGAGMTFADQQREVQRRGCVVPQAIADVWSLTLGRLFMEHCGDDLHVRTQHCGRTATVFNGCPIVIYSLQFGLGIDIGLGVAQDRADDSTYVSCEIPP